LATSEEGEIRFEGVLLSIDGKERIHIEKVMHEGQDAVTFGNDCANEVLANGGAELMKKIRTEMNT